eukprot:403353478
MKNQAIDKDQKSFVHAGQLINQLSTTSIPEVRVLNEDRLLQTQETKQNTVFSNRKSPVIGYHNSRKKTITNQVPQNIENSNTNQTTKLLMTQQKTSDKNLSMHQEIFNTLIQRRQSNQNSSNILSPNDIFNISENIKNKSSDEHHLAMFYMQGNYNGQEYQEIPLRNSNPLDQWNPRIAQRPNHENQEEECPWLVDSLNVQQNLPFQQRNSRHSPPLRIENFVHNDPDQSQNHFDRQQNEKINFSNLLTNEQERIKFDEDGRSEPFIQQINRAVNYFQNSGQMLKNKMRLNQSQQRPVLNRQGIDQINYSILHENDDIRFELERIKEKARQNKFKSKATVQEMQRHISLIASEKLMLEKEVNELKIQLKESEIKLNHFTDMYDKEKQEKDSIIQAFQQYLMNQQLKDSPQSKEYKCPHECGVFNNMSTNFSMVQSQARPIKQKIWKEAQSNPVSNRMLKNSVHLRERSLNPHVLSNPSINLSNRFGSGEPAQIHNTSLNYYSGISQKQKMKIDGRIMSPDFHSQNNKKQATGQQFYSHTRQPSPSQGYEFKYSEDGGNIIDDFMIGKQSKKGKNAPITNFPKAKLINIDKIKILESLAESLKKRTQIPLSGREEYTKITGIQQHQVYDMKQKETSTFDREIPTLDKSNHIRYSFQNPMIDPTQATPQAMKMENLTGDFTSSAKKRRPVIVSNNGQQINLNRSMLEEKFENSLNQSQIVKKHNFVNQMEKQLAGNKAASNVIKATLSSFGRRITDASSNIPNPYSSQSEI